MNEIDEIEKLKIFSLTKIIDYKPGEVECKSILKKITGNISVIAIDAGITQAEKTLPFDTFLQIIEGKAEIEIDARKLSIEAGQGIIIPAHARNLIRSDVRFTMLLTIIKSGYEEIYNNGA